MRCNTLSHNISHDEFAGAVAALLDTGHRLALVAAHDEGDAVRIVYVLLAGSRSGALS
ncbi:hypothetical protein [Mycobacterium szulgai]|uniref:hypothetical protein n=1 Tax=Mycobacterium szulgai TaxID=1787 RepID=UPI0035579F93